jgi:hypothetical protein
MRLLAPLPGFMRLTLSFWECLCAALTVASLPNVAPGATDDAANVAAQCHYAGGVQLAGNTNHSNFQKALALPSAVAVRKLALARISGLLANSFQCGTNTPAASLIEPLLNDVLNTELFGSFGGSAPHPLSFVLALRLDAKRAQLWQDNLSKAFGEAGEKMTAEGFSGWRWKLSGSDSFWMMPARDWLLVGRGDDLLPVQAGYLRQLSGQGRPGPTLTDHWLEADLDWARLSAWLPEWSQLLKPARIKIGLATVTNNLSMTARVSYPEAIPWKSGSWQTPAELVSSPLASFTAGQNIAAFLNLNPIFSRLDDNPFTNQFYVWALSEMPLLTYMAWPAANATNALEKLSTNAPAAFNPGLQQFNGTKLVWQAKLGKLVLLNLRVLSPSLEAVQAKTGEFLFAGFFPRLRMIKPAPDELWKQIRGRADLVYYDWDSTSLRLQQWRLLGRVLSRPRMPTEDMMEAMDIENKWLKELDPFAGNTITEITRVAPNELSMVRNSPLGLTGIELFLLSEWLGDVGSPPIHLPPPHVEP